MQGRLGLTDFWWDLSDLSCTTFCHIVNGSFEGFQDTYSRVSPLISDYTFLLNNLWNPRETWQNWSSGLHALSFQRSAAPPTRLWQCFHPKLDTSQVPVGGIGPLNVVRNNPAAMYLAMIFLEALRQLVDQGWHQPKPANGHKPPEMPRLRRIWTEDVAVWLCGTQKRRQTDESFPGSLSLKHLKKSQIHPSTVHIISIIWSLYHLTTIYIFQIYLYWIIRVVTTCFTNWVFNSETAVHSFRDSPRFLGESGGQRHIPWSSRNHTTVPSGPPTLALSAASRWMVSPTLGTWISWIHEQIWNCIMF